MTPGGIVWRGGGQNILPETRWVLCSGKYPFCALRRDRFCAKEQFLHTSNLGLRLVKVSEEGRLTSRERDTDVNHHSVLQSA